MIKPLFLALGSVTLALGLVFAPLSPAFAGQIVTLDGVTATDGIYGNGPDDTVGASTGNGGWDWDDPGDLLDPNGNTVNFTNGTSSTGIRGAYIENGGSIPDSEDVAANDNRVNISDSYVLGVHGASARSYGSGDATASGNTVTFEGASAGSIYGGSAGSATGTATATNNTVTISDSQVMDVRGGSAESVTGDATATGNTVTINSGTANGDIYGGRAESASGIATATDNTVNIRGTPSMTTANLYGGGGGGLAGSDFRTGNTLNLHSQVAVATVRNFENWNFYLPSTMTAGETMLTVTGIALLGENAKINVAIEGGSSSLGVGDKVYLIDADDLDGNLAAYTANGSGMQGITLRYEFDLDLDDKQLWTTVTSVGVSGHLKALLEGRLAGLAFASWGSDLIIGPGMYAAMMETERKGAGLVPFAALKGGSVRYDTGSHIDVDGVHLLAGLAWRAPLAGKNSLVTGAFFEAGWGSYDSRNSFNNMPSVKGKGDTNYYGGGILGRYEAQAGPGGVYGEGSLRAGYADTDFRSRDILNSSGGRTSYDSGSMYYGAHLGAGYLWNINKKASLDVSTKYIWLHLDSDSVSISGDKVKFKAANSHRWRTGGQFSYAVNTYVAPYAGAYFDYEFDGKAKGTSNGYKIDEPDFDGATGAGELGLILTPAPNLPLSLDLGVQGYVGTREGVTGSLRMKYEF